ncbi:ABC transporter permease subunit [Campylobacter mucosalis]|uniref:Dipeptide/oligopeptide/nickel ABC transporter, permease protein n=1 Tax=Campylobacter mucosalis CCUG 21559 TaxID=1032067 RepID=A0A6G5QFP9_9BACT|nr:ABC transporter permease subunit [Campylobacter mucosalis]QCD44397.1 dipeptide/oligopeptide/nickel ABC transporter, permease protein [Campylobacter mucosalis CCUG 21559]
MKILIIKRIFFAIFTLLGVSFVVFFILRLNGTDAALSYLTASGIAPTKEALAEARAYLGLDKPLFMQYFLWLGDALRLNFGISYITGKEVSPLMLYYFKNSIKLVLLSLCFTLVFSLILGIASAFKKDHFIDHFTRFFAFVGVSVPNFWLGFVLISVFSVKFQLLPPFGSGTFLHLIMPAFAMSLMSLCINARLIRANILSTMSQRHVLYAKMRGVKGSELTFKFILKSALLPVITAVGMHFGELLGAAIVVENVFAYPGVGTFIINAVSSNDYPVILCFMILFCAVFIVSNIITDILYILIDPRLRHIK